MKIVSTALFAFFVAASAQAAMPPQSPLLSGKLPIGDCNGYETCAEASLAAHNYVDGDCQKVQNEAQDRCAAMMIRRKGHVDSDCFRLESGSDCAAASIQRKGYIDSDCFKVQNYRQDRCAAATLAKSGYVNSDCLKLP